LKLFGFCYLKRSRGEFGGFRDVFFSCLNLSVYLWMCFCFITCLYIDNNGFVKKKEKLKIDYLI